MKQVHELTTQSTSASNSNSTPVGEPLRIAVLISGSGRSLENIHRKITQGQLHARIELVICSKPDVFGIQRAKQLNLPCLVISRRAYHNTQSFSEAIWASIQKIEVDIVCLAGFLCLLSIPSNMTNRVLNIHPALLPSFGGQGMYGHHVHEAVLRAGCKISGCTVHIADQNYDTGPIILQRSCPVYHDDTPDTLANRVFEQECLAYPEALKLFQEKRIIFQGRIAQINREGC